jgi:AcrR family transcriptional regulator
MTLDEIARLAGVGKSTLYARFPDRTESTHSISNAR